MNDFLLELFSEEIPARMQKNAALHLFMSFEQRIKDAGLACGSIRMFSTPRRIALLAADMPLMQPDVTVEKKGPKTSAPQAAIDGFIKSSGVSLEKLEKRMVGKDETYFAVIHKKGEPSSVVLKGIVEHILAEFPWPKSMRWGSGDTHWVRPLHSILCLLGSEVIPVQFAGLTANNVTYGHRFLAPAAITITATQQYEAALEKAYVIADRDKRLQKITSQSAAAAQSKGLQLRKDTGLEEEVAGLVEWPTVLTGRIDDAFMDLPPEVLVSEMRAHQKYFALEDKHGRFAPHFLITSNMIAQDGGKAIIAGNERVLRARLSDGRFFYDQDRKKRLEEWAEGLKGVTFHAKIGTLAQKVQRIEALAQTLSSFIPGSDQALVKRAASLCKADLLTGMVGEFPELQGIMGRYYALHQGEDAAVASAIAEHYLPLGPDSPVPTAPVSVCIALADKLDTIISLFAAGEKPTGSKDPFALRRAALGIIRIILENGLRLKLSTLLLPHPGPLPKGEGENGKPPASGKELGEGSLLTFFADRLKVMLRDQGIRHDVVAAVMQGGDDDLTRVVARAKALQDFLGSDDGANLLAAYRRARNIVAIEEKKDGVRYEARALDAAKLRETEETQLLGALDRVQATLDGALAAEDYELAMAILANLRAPLDNFFDRILVNCENTTLRAERLRLLARIRSLMDTIADFSLVEDAR